MWISDQTGRSALSNKHYLLERSDGVVSNIPKVHNVYLAYMYMYITLDTAV